MRRRKYRDYIGILLITIAVTFITIFFSFVSDRISRKSFSDTGGQIDDDSIVIVIDAGHGGNDPGALGELDGKTIRESDLTLSISNKVKKLVEEAGYKVYMTRSTDVYKTLVERPAYANKIDAAVFVSIHINSAESNEAYGSEVYYAESNNENLYGTTSSVLAKNVLNRMLLNTGAANRGVRTAEHAVTKRSNMPSCLVEVGFISNTDELAKMVDNTYQNKVAKGIADGILLTLKDITVFD